MDNSSAYSNSSFPATMSCLSCLFHDHQRSCDCKIPRPLAYCEVSSKRDISYSHRRSSTNISLTRIAGLHQHDISYSHRSFTSPTRSSRRHPTISTIPRNTPNHCLHTPHLDHRILKPHVSPCTSSPIHHRPTQTQHKPNDSAPPARAEANRIPWPFPQRPPSPNPKKLSASDVESVPCVVQPSILGKLLRLKKHVKTNRKLWMIVGDAVLPSHHPTSPRLFHHLFSHPLWHPPWRS